jgi:transposase
MLTELFTSALGLQRPWQVVNIRFAHEQGRIDFDLEVSGNRLTCPACQADNQPIHDRLERSWRHLNFFQYQAFLHAPIPRVKCAACGKTTQIVVPWANPKSGFSLLFEALALCLAQHMPMAQVAALLGVNANPLWERLTRTVMAAHDQENYADVRAINVDETASKRGHNYVTVVADSEARRVVFATEGKDAQTLADFASKLKDHGGDAAQIKAISMDFSAAFIKGATDYFPNAKVCFDQFHIVSMANKAVDAVRRSEVGSEPILRKQRFSILKDANTLTVKQTAFMESFAHSHLKTARAWRMKEALRDIVREKLPAQATQARLESLLNWLRRSQLAPMIALAKTINKHLEGIVRAIAEQRSNGFAESLNSQIQAARARAKGYKTAENFICMIYLLAAKLKHLPICPWRANNLLMAKAGRPSKIVISVAN